VAAEARGLWGCGHGLILPRLNSIEDNGVVSHPFRNERGMDVHPRRNGWGTRGGGAGQFYESTGFAGESCILQRRVRVLVV
jgi:hypothetical protein